MVREVLSKVQAMRKEAGFEVTDHIRVSVQGNEKLEKLLKKHKSEILPEVLAEDLVFDTKIGYSKEWNVNGEEVTLGVEKLG